MRRVFTLAAGVLVVAAPQFAWAQSRPLRLFLSTIGLSNPADPSSPTDNPSPELGTNPSVVIPSGGTTRLYVWAQITPPGTPNNVIYNGVSLRTRVEGDGGVISSYNFWNYTNGSYGANVGRWSSQVSGSNGTNLAWTAGVAVVAGAGVNNSNTANAVDTQYERFALDGTTRIDATLLGYIEVTGNTAGALEVHLAVGQQGVSQVGAGVQPVYLGWGDESQSPLNNQPNAESPIADATILVTPEPSTILSLLIGAGALVARRRSR